MGNGRDVAGRVRQRQFAIAGRRGLLEHYTRHFIDQAFTEQPVLGHGKAVIRR